MRELNLDFPVVQTSPHLTKLCCFKVHFNIILPPLEVFQLNFVCICHLFHICYISCPSHIFLIIKIVEIVEVEIMKQIVTKFSSSSWYFLFFDPNILGTFFSNILNVSQKYPHTKINIQIIINYPIFVSCETSRENQNFSYDLKISGLFRLSTF